MNKAYQSNYQPVIGNNYFDCLEVVPTTNYFGDVNYVAKVDVSDKFEVGRHYLWFNQVHYDYEDKTGHIAVIYKAEKYLNAPVKSFSETFGLTSADAPSPRAKPSNTHGGSRTSARNSAPAYGASPTSRPTALSAKLKVRSAWTLFRKINARRA